MTELRELLLDNEDWLRQRLQEYVTGRGYAQDTAALQRASRLSISGLNQALLLGMETLGGQAPEFAADADLTQDPIAAFGVAEARLHRQRGISLALSLRLLKDCRQSYQDLVQNTIDDHQQRDRHEHCIVRCFDLIELALCSEWTAVQREEVIEELQQGNRTLSHENNRYLTLFESLPDPALLIDPEHVILACNPAAARFVHGEASPVEIDSQDQDPKPRQQCGHDVHAASEAITGRPLNLVLPWLAERLSLARTADDTIRRLEIQYEQDGQSRHFIVTVADMLDVFGRYDGAVLLVSEVTDRKKAEEALKASEEAFRQLAVIDPLTGAHNRRSFLEQAESEWKRSRRYEHPLSVLMIDIDHFKLVNDTYGHDIGDVTLQVLTRACMKILRENDIFGRLGGEEFAALPVETDEDRALQVAERLRREIAELRVSHADLSFLVQISIGAATLLEDDDRVEIMLKKADQALYKAKCFGRNRVVAASQLALLP